MISTWHLFYFKNSLFHSIKPLYLDWKMEKRLMRQKISRFDWQFIIRLVYCEFCLCRICSWVRVRQINIMNMKASFRFELHISFENINLFTFEWYKIIIIKRWMGIMLKKESTAERNNCRVKKGQSPWCHLKTSVQRV